MPTTRPSTGTSAGAPTADTGTGGGAEALGDGERDGRGLRGSTLGDGDAELPGDAEPLGDADVPGDADAPAVSVEGRLERRYQPAAPTARSTTSAKSRALRPTRSPRRSWSRGSEGVLRVIKRARGLWVPASGHSARFEARAGAGPAREPLSAVGSGSLRAAVRRDSVRDEGGSDGPGPDPAARHRTARLR